MEIGNCETHSLHVSTAYTFKNDTILQLSKFME